MQDLTSIKSLSTADLFKVKGSAPIQESTTDFAQELKNALGNVNEIQVQGEKAMSDIATGSVKDHFLTTIRTTFIGTGGLSIGDV